MNKHETHPEIINRLKRASGHLQKVVEMIEKEKGCLEVAQQLQAVSNAISNAKQKYVEDHIEHCIEASENMDKKVISKKINELKKIAKYL
ncbi:MAG: metal-sensing transcriptional repressor [Nitrospinae bacterium]|nr:metal-sensing transcriptional repressor [Nitrospinota bacterium]